MCGIIACIGSDDAVGELVTGLENLEYRGYDSAGIAVQNGHGIEVRKQAGEISQLKARLETDAPTGTVGIGHTRWSTHGPPTDENAHPHTGERRQVAAVHNGIIENYEGLRHRLEREGRTFTSDTDTEVIPHLVEQYLDDGHDPETAFRHAIADLEGSFAVALLVDGDDVVYAARQDSPLVLGVADSSYYLASDVPAFLEFTDEVVYLEDGDVATVSADGYAVTDGDREPVSRTSETVAWDPEETGKGTYDHYMLKEIDSQPDALTNTLNGRIDDGTVTLEEFPPGTFDGVERVQFVACGTSYHAALCGQRQLGRAGVVASATRASEVDDVATINDDTLVVAVTQSGETADTLSAMRYAADRGAETVAVTNVVGSTAAREADRALYIRAGPEIGVAATKTFTSQVATLSMLTHRVAGDLAGAEQRDDAADYFRDLARLPEHVDELLERTQAYRVSSRIMDQESYFFIGRGYEHAVAREGALKFKEITYEHAEGFASGELKHGPLALVKPKTTVFALLTGDRGEETRKNAQEARTRGAHIVAVAPDGHPVGDIADEVLRVPDTHPAVACVLANVQLQLVSYHTAADLGRAIDKPRNLAKSVTVE